jgi:uncharacterized protein (TIGR02421 family)
MTAEDRTRSAAMPPGALAADTELAEISASFDYLLYVSPSNSEEAWQGFSAADFEQEPLFVYREIDLDVDSLQHRLGDLHAAVAAIEDVAIARLLEGKRQELVHHLGLLTERGTDAFLRRSLELSGPVEADLADLAEEILIRLGDAGTDPDPTVTPAQFAARAEAEIEAYREQDPTFTASVELRDDVASLMVSGDRLFVPVHRSFSEVRVEPLVHHEVGVHVLTHWNGRVQPLRMLANGLGGYQETQEGLGVLAELMVDGLTVSRLRELAARVVAVRSVIEGATFGETFGHLHSDRGLPAQRSFDLADRVHRGGGLVKDAAYLRGLVRLIEHLQDGHDLDPLLVGKPSLDDIDDIEALLDRGVLTSPRLRPRWLDGAGGERFAQLCDAPDPLSVLLP